MYTAFACAVRGPLAQMFIANQVPIIPTRFDAR